MEIEVKILGIDAAAVQQKLLELGAILEFDGLLRVEYFDFPDGRIRKAHNLLRIREFIAHNNTPAPKKALTDKKTEFVFKCDKHIIDGCKAYNELEIFVDDALRLRELLRHLGLDTTIQYEKKRKQFVYQDWKFEFDEYPGVPIFLEIEADDAAKVNEAVKLLGLQNHEHTTETAEELLAHRYNDISLNGLRFPENLG